MTRPTILAAGAAIYREREGSVEVLIVHRPSYDDWTWPKGKLKKGESLEECALREVLEETGVEGELGPELASVEYLDSSGSPKRATYFSMSYLRDLGHAPDSEVDRLAWIALDQVGSTLSNPSDREISRALRTLLHQEDLST